MNFKTKILCVKVHLTKRLESENYGFYGVRTFQPPPNNSYSVPDILT